jgi:hypothetical protein
LTLVPEPAFTIQECGSHGLLDYSIAPGAPVCSGEV